MSKSRLLALLVEGNDDDRFVGGVLKPRFEHRYTSVFQWRYSEEREEQVNEFIRSIEKIGGEYLLLADLDDASCVTERKAQLTSRYSALAADRIVVVITEIESWYYAGLPHKCTGVLKALKQRNTDELTKEDLRAVRPRAVSSRVDFLIELLKAFSFPDAKQRNTSFDYLCKKHDCQ
jgi:hypothetical protein